MANKKKFQPNNTPGKRPQVKGPAPIPAQMEIDKSKLPDTNNEALEEKLTAFRGAPDNEKLEDVIDTLRGCSVFMTAIPTGPNMLNPEIWRSTDGKAVFFMFSSREQIPDGFKCRGIVMLACKELIRVAVKAAIEDKKISHVVLNPYTHNVTLVPQLIEVMRKADVDEEKKNEHIRVRLTGPKLPELHNEELEEVIYAQAEEQDMTKKNALLNRMLNLLQKASLLGCSGRGADDKMHPQVAIDNNTKLQYLQIVTSAEGLNALKDKPAQVSVISFKALMDTVLNSKDENLDGMLIRTPKALIKLDRKLLNHIKDVNEKMASGEQTIEMIPEALRPAMMHVRFETKHLPKLLQEQGEAFVNALMEGREAFLDETFEKMYYDIREYPYLEEEFGLLTVNPEEKLLLISIDFPERDQMAGCAPRAYILWDEEKKTGRYYAVILQPDKSLVITECDGTTSIAKSPAPDDGNEWHKILEIYHEAR